MGFYGTLFEVIDMRSFSNLWYWIALAVAWSSASHFVLGVPWDLVRRGQRTGGQAARDVEAMVSAQVRRLVMIDEAAGLWALAILSGALTALALLGFLYGVEFAQALFLLTFPLAAVGGLTLALARRLAAQAALGRLGPEDLYPLLRRHRRITQAIGMLSIFVTAMFGMYQNLTLSAW